VGSSLTVAVVGGGLAGLVAARELSRRGAAVILLESSRRLGGQVFTQRQEGFIVEHGAEGFSPASRVVTDLLEELGLTHRTVAQRLLAAYEWSGGELRSIPASRAASLAGIQTSGRDSGRGLISLENGMGELVESLARDVAEQGEIRTGVEVTGIERGPGGLCLRLQDGSSLVVDRAVAAVPPEALERMVPERFKELPKTLREMPAFSSVSVSLAYPADRVARALDAAGMVVAGESPGGPGFRACVFSSSKFPNRAPEGWVLLRLFFRPGRDYPLGAPDTWWVERGAEAVSEPLGITGRPVLSWVARWERALPLWEQGRAGLVRRLRGVLRRDLGLEVAGSHYRRSGIAGAVLSGMEAARRVAPRPGIA